MPNGTFYNQYLRFQRFPTMTLNYGKGGGQGHDVEPWRGRGGGGEGRIACQFEL